MRDRTPFWIGTVGFGLAAQFDGFLLHRVLGWHHLLSQARPEAALHEHQLADAAFDAAMTAVLLVGLVGLLANRGRLHAVAPALALADALVGFGLWHLVDAVVVHALLRLHRIHPTAAHPLMWDLLWPALFGLLPLGVAAALRRAPVRVAPIVAVPSPIPEKPRRSPGTRRHRKGPKP